MHLDAIPVGGGGSNGRDARSCITHKTGTDWPKAIMRLTMYQKIPKEPMLAYIVRRIMNEDVNRQS